jgi:hypothetical protein
MRKRRRLRLLALLAPSIAACGLAPRSARAGTGATGTPGASGMMSTGYITGLNGVCLDLPDSTANGTNARIWTCTRGRSQQGWQLTPQGTIQGIDGKCLTVAGGSFVDHAAIQLFDCNGSGFQKWTWAADGTLQIGGKCLDIPWADPTPGNSLQLYDCLPTQSNQQWIIHGDQPLRNPLGGCLDIPNGQLYDGAPVNYYACHGARAQNFVFTPEGLLRADDGECVQANGGSGSALTLNACTGAPEQRWTHSSIGWSPASAPSLCMQPSTFTNGSPVELLACINQAWQHWGADTMLTVSLIPQWQSNWCWAAASEMIMAYMGYDVPQCTQANQALNRTDCCYYSSTCNYGGLPTFGFNGFTSANNGTGIYFHLQGPLDFATLQSEIASNRPVAFAWNWTSGGGHLMVVIGATVREGIEWVTINDPWDVNYGDQTDITYTTWVAVPGNHTHQQDWWDIQRIP